MTLDERCDAIARELYMGEIPDVWNMMCRAVIMKHMRELVEETQRNIQQSSS